MLICISPRLYLQPSANFYRSISTETEETLHNHVNLRRSGNGKTRVWATIESKMRLSFRCVRYCCSFLNFTCKSSFKSISKKTKNKTKTKKQKNNKKRAFQDGCKNVCVCACTHMCVPTWGGGKVAEFNLFNVLNGAGYTLYQTVRAIYKSHNLGHSQHRLLICRLYLQPSKSNFVLH